MARFKLFKSQYRRRGTLGAILSVSCNFGIFLGFIITSIFEYHIVPLVVLGIAVLYSISIVFVKESPNFMEIRGKHEIAKEISKYYTGRHIQPIRTGKDESLPVTKISFEDFSKSI